MYVKVYGVYTWRLRGATEIIYLSADGTCPLLLLIDVNVS